MEKIVAKIAALGVPGLVLLLTMSATGLSGAAAITTALAAKGREQEIYLRKNRKIPCLKIIEKKAKRGTRQNIIVKNKICLFHA